MRGIIDLQVYIIMETDNFQNSGAIMRRVVRKVEFHLCENIKAQISFADTAKLISAFVFITMKEISLVFINPKFRVSNLTAQAGLCQIWSET